MQRHLLGFFEKSWRKFHDCRPHLLSFHGGVFAPAEKRFSISSTVENFAPGLPNKHLMEKSDEELLSLSKEQLVARIRQLERPSTSQCATKEPRRKKKERQFNFDQHPKRQIALQVAYYGAKYRGLVGAGLEVDETESVESEIFQALRVTKLIENDREAWHYARCGRTDAGVSAYRQVLSIRVRCKQSQGIGVVPAVSSKAAPSDGPVENRTDPECVEETDEPEEIDFASLLNHRLPDEIRVLAWAPVHLDFNARFDCKSRTYRYLFPSSGLKMDKMQDGAQRFVGEHDFRNLCAFNSSAKSWTRSIYESEIKPASTSFSGVHGIPWLGGDQMMVFEIRSRGFLYHQIRCMMGVLLLIGSGYEEPSIIDKLLDVENVPGKPEYAMVDGHPLIFLDAEFDGVSWRRSPQAYQRLTDCLLQTRSKQATQLAYTEGLIDIVLNSRLQSSSSVETVRWADHPLCDPRSGLQDPLLPRSALGKRKSYRPLLEREKGPPYEKRLATLQARQAAQKSHDARYATAEKLDMS